MAFLLTVSDLLKHPGVLQFLNEWSFFFFVKQILKQKLLVLLQWREKCAKQGKFREGSLHQMSKDLAPKMSWQEEKA